MIEVLNTLVTTFQGLYLVFADLLGYGWGLIALSILTAFLYAPLEKWAQHLKASETKIQNVIQPQLKDIATNLTGQEAWAATQRLYKRYRYHPLKAIRTAAFPLLQLPLLFLAFYSLSSLELLKGISLGPIEDLSQPDKLLFGLALLPFLMTVINIAVTFTDPFTKRERVQAIVIALFFLVLLYSAPAALLIYWTTNNFIGLIKALYLKHSKAEININWIKKVKDAPSCVWTLPLCPLVPTLFLWANNVAYYPIKSIFASLTLIIICSSICYFVLFQISNKVHVQSRLAKLFFFCLYCLFSGFVICALGYSSIHGLFYDYRFHVLVCFPILLVLLIYLINFRIINCLLIAQILISLSIFCFNYGTDKQQVPGQEIATSDLPKFKTKPNIYYFLCESYQNLSYVKEVFGYDSTEFLNRIKHRGYTVYDDIFSNSSYTLGTLTNIFTMNANILPPSSSVSLDASSWERSVIGGGKGNKLLEILKYNGYETSVYFKGDIYFFKSKGELLDFTDVGFGIRNLLQPIEDTNSLMPHLLYSIFSILNKTSNVEQDSLKILKMHLERSKNSSKPQFFAHRLQRTNHTPPIGYDYHHRQTFIDSQFYQNGVAEGNAEIETIIETIEINDPNSIIIFLGDHGAWTLRGFPINRSPEDLLVALNEENVTLDSLIKDMFYVFAAIKLPEGITTLEQFSPADIFTQLFGRLSQEPNQGYNSNEICVKLFFKNNESLCKKREKNIDKILESEHKWYQKIE